MTILRCSQGHFYDGDTYDTCPTCLKSADEVMLMGVPTSEMGCKDGNFLESWDIKEKCRRQKELRRETARINDIPIEIRDCTQAEPCVSPCKACEMELLYLNACLKARRSAGQPVTFPGYSESRLGF